MSDDNAKRPRNCGECMYWAKVEGKPYGYCDNWAGVRLESGSVCHPNLGIKKENDNGK